jgi:Zn-dependent protease with chaperone function
VSGLLSHAVAHAVRGRTVEGASQSFGVIALCLMMLLAVEWEAVRLARARSSQWALITVITVPLGVVVALTIAARLVPLFT